MFRDALPDSAEARRILVATVRAALAAPAQRTYALAGVGVLFAGSWFVLAAGGVAGQHGRVLLAALGVIGCAVVSGCLFASVLAVRLRGRLTPEQDGRAPAPVPRADLPAPRADLPAPLARVGPDGRPAAEP